MRRLLFVGAALAGIALVPDFRDRSGPERQDPPGTDQTNHAWTNATKLRRDRRGDQAGSG